MCDVRQRVERLRSFFYSLFNSHSLSFIDMTRRPITDCRVLEHTLTAWNLDLLHGTAQSLDGSFVVGTIAETLPAETNRTGTALVQAVVSAKQAVVLVETLAMLLRLQWIFQHHPMATIVSVLSDIDGDTSRDYLVLKGCVEHGLDKELAFRSSQHLAPRAMEERIQQLSRALFENLQQVQKRKAVTAVTQTYASFMGA